MDDMWLNFNGTPSVPERSEGFLRHHGQDVF